MDLKNLQAQPGSAPAYPPQVEAVNSAIPPLPPSPAGIPGEALSQDQMKGNIQDLMGKIQGRYQDFNSSTQDATAGLEGQKELTLKEIFDLLRSIGIDPSNVEQVNAFLEKIKATNPELYQQIEKSLETLMGTGDAAPEDVTQGAGEIPPGNMNINTNETPQQNL